MDSSNCDRRLLKDDMEGECRDYMIRQRVPYINFILTQ